ncbi:hypothetical protein Trydic_g18258 [Trypoxylus dichotomus]
MNVHWSKSCAHLGLYYRGHGGPSKSTLQHLVAKFETTGSVNNQPTPIHQNNARSAVDIATIRGNPDLANLASGLGSAPVQDPIDPGAGS